MDIDVKKIINDASSGAAYDNYVSKINKTLYPAIFANSEHSCFHIKKALDIHNQFVKEYMEIALQKIIKEIKD